MLLEISETDGLGDSPRSWSTDVPDAEFLTLLASLKEVACSGRYSADGPIFTVALGGAIIRIPEYPVLMETSHDLIRQARSASGERWGRRRRSGSGTPGDGERRGRSRRSRWPSESTFLGSSPEVDAELSGDDAAGIPEVPPEVLISSYRRATIALSRVLERAVPLAQIFIAESKGVVTVIGTASSLTERARAGFACWALPETRAVYNCIVVAQSCQDVSS